MTLYTIDTSHRLEPHLSQEWLLTNGIGGFASGSVVGCNTRRYHGLLCAATLPPVGRVLALQRVAELFILDGKADRPYETSINQFAHGFHPRGDRHLNRFELGDTARWHYDIEDVRMTKELQILQRRNIVGLRYTLTPPAGRKVEMRLLPFAALRDFHSLRRQTGWHFDVQSTASSVRLSNGREVLNIISDRAPFSSAPAWWYDHTYAIESARGQDDREDLFTPGYFAVETSQPVTITLWAGTDPLENLDWDAELKNQYLASRCQSGPAGTILKLNRAANDFVVQRKAPDGSVGATIIAGYPWFSDWGRDTMISLPGLLLTTKRYEQAKRVLSIFAQYVSQGMIPNVFDDYSNEPHYNTVDASLWFIHACFEYLRHTGDQETFKRVLRPACEAIFVGYRDGTRFNIKMDPADGLISQGDPQTQLTWMDAKHGGIAFTPRQGKPVEINALWYNALRYLGQNELADRVAAGFQQAFWINSFRGLADVVEGSRRDTAIRPNQIFAVSLPHSPLSDEQRFAIVEVVRRELLTPYGLRTLARHDPGYQSHYSGPQSQRDAAYHNGTVWPWPIGAFLEAYLKVHQRSAASVQQARTWLQPLIDHLNHQACIGQISEIFDADPPHNPGGCCAQAWSIAEVLRLAAELEIE